MIQRTLDLEYDKLVIGSDLSAFSFCYINKIPSLYLRINKPYKYDDKNEWKNDREIWNKMSFLLSINKYTPFSNKITSARIDGNTLKCITKDSLSLTISFNELYIFDDYKLEGLPNVIGKTDDTLHVLDYFNVSMGCQHEFDYILDNDNFVKKIIFYRSKRIPKTFINKKIKDCISISTIKESDILLDEFSQNYARLKTKKMMADAGIKGVYDKTDNYYRKIQLESDIRKVYELGKNIYNDLPNNIKFVYNDYRQILSQEEIEDEYLTYIKNIYGITI